MAMFDGMNFGLPFGGFKNSGVEEIGIPDLQWCKPTFAAAVWPTYNGIDATSRTDDPFGMCDATNDWVMVRKGGLYVVYAEVTGGNNTVTHNVGVHALNNGSVISGGSVGSVTGVGGITVTGFIMMQPGWYFKWWQSNSFGSSSSVGGWVLGPIAPNLKITSA